MQGAGWLTTEELVWDDKGRLTTHAPFDLQDPRLLGPARSVQRRPLGKRLNRENTIYPLQSRRRAAFDAGHFSAAGAM